ncbi:MAG: hypothetical protein AAB388_03130 [Patescibacteria group bacterium]
MKKSFITAIILVILHTYPLVVAAETTGVSYSTQQTIATLLKQIASLQAQLSLLQTANQSGASKPPTDTVATQEWSFNIQDHSFDYIHHDDENYEEVEEEANIYSVRNNRLYKIEKRKTDRYDMELWDIFKEVSDPKVIESWLGWFATYEDPDSAVLAFVQEIHSGDRGWVLAVNTHGIDLSNTEARQGLILTLLHEYGHLITLNASQIYNHANAAACAHRVGTFHVEINDELRVCPNRAAYINKFATAFWSPDMAREAVEHYNSETTNEFYDDYSDSFITTYSASTPFEDIAEVFSAFVLNTQVSSNTLASDKIEFFFDFPELVELRNQVRKNVSGYFIDGA